MTPAEFTTFIREKGAELFRDMPWRTDTRPYYILVSEMMLQQTQVARVTVKFREFIARFPNEKSLATADLADALRVWNGLGYNRRAKFLHEAAKEIVRRGIFPVMQNDLEQLPGIGPNTAGAIMVYSFDQPAIFVETNIRTVYLHHFFRDQTNVSDTKIREKLTQTLDCERPREFYWALMDYGAWLKQQDFGAIQRSKHFAKQSPLKGSIREVRGQIIHTLTVEDLSEPVLRKMVKADVRFTTALDGLLHDGLVERKDKKLRLAK